MGAPSRSLSGMRVPSVPAWPTLRRRLIVGAILLALLAAGYLLWFRHSSLVAVQSVDIEGAEGVPEVDVALRDAALRQSTLDVDLAALEASVAAEPAVRSVAASADFPHGLRVEVDLREPAGWLSSQGVVVAEDGVVLERAAERPEGMAEIDVKGEAPAVAERLSGDALRVANVMGAAPGPLAEQASRAEIDREFGVVVELDPGLELRFGEPGDAGAKWQAVAAVLADRGFEGAAYLDLSVPERPVAGGVADPSESLEGEELIAPEVQTPEEAVAPEALPEATAEAVPAAPIEPPVVPGDTLE